MSKWKQMVLGDMGHTYGGLTNKTIVDFGFGKPFIPYMNIFSNGKINPKFLVLVNIHPGERQNTVKYGDLFFTTSSETVEEVGMTSVLLDDIGEAYLNSFCFGFRLNNFDDLLPEFAPFLFRGIELRKKISLFGQGSTRYNLPKTELLVKLKIDLPTIPEQRKIAKILSTTDTVIDKTQAAIAKYKAIKQGMLHDLFTRGIDTKTGKLRNKLEDAPELYRISKSGQSVPINWNEIEKVGDHILITPGFPFNSNCFNTNSKGLPLIRIRDLLKSKIETYYDGEYDINYLINENDILIGMDGDFHIVKWKNKNRALLNQRIMKIGQKENSPINVDYFYYFLFSFLRDIWSKTGATTVKHLSTFDISLATVIIPDVEEQKLIAQKIISIENKLENEQNYLQKLQKIKSGIMADLLSGNKYVEISPKL